jgi:hypothetical protein
MRVVVAVLLVIGGVFLIAQIALHASRAANQVDGPDNTTPTYAPVTPGTCYFVAGQVQCS